MMQIAMQVGAELGNQYNEVLAAQDVATIGGLCALASFDRSELCRHVIDNVAFREYLQLCPEVRAWLILACMCQRDSACKCMIMGMQWHMPDRQLLSNMWFRP